MADILQVEALRFAYPPLASDALAPYVLDGVNLAAAQGEWLAVMGASDAGKTTLCLLASGLAPHLSGGTQEGVVRVAGRDTRQCPPPALAATAGILFQDPEAQLFNATVEAEVAWGLENLGLPRPEMHARVQEVLSRLLLEPLRHRSPLSLSGGEKKRLALASVLAMRPSLLVLDEPMGGLDPSGRETVLATLSELAHEHSVTILMTESDPEPVTAFAARVAILDGGRVAIEGTPRTLMPQVERLGAAGVAAPQMAQLAAALSRSTGSQFDFLTVAEARQAILDWMAKESRPGLGADGRMEVARGVSRAGQMPEKETAIEVSGLWHWYEDERSPALTGTDLGIRAGDLVALVGANGSGKTTLIKHFNGLLCPKRGRVQIFGRDTAGRPIGELARSVGFLFQSPEQQIFSPTVRQEVAFGARNMGLAAGEVERRVDEALARFDLTQVADTPPAVLGYGLRRRVTLASLAAVDPPVLVLDEPTVGLDAPGREELLRWLRERHAAGRTIILVTHDMALVAECAERAVVLCRGSIIADGTPAEIFAQPDLLRRASLVSPPVVSLAHSLRPYALVGDCVSVQALADAVAALGGRT